MGCSPHNRRTDWGGGGGGGGGGYICLLPGHCRYVVLHRDIFVQEEELKTFGIDYVCRERQKSTIHIYITNTMGVCRKGGGKGRWVRRPPLLPKTRSSITLKRSTFFITPSVFNTYAYAF